MKPTQALPPGIKPYTGPIDPRLERMQDFDEDIPGGGCASVNATRAMLRARPNAKHERLVCIVVHFEPYTGIIDRRERVKTAVARFLNRARYRDTSSDGWILLTEDGEQIPMNGKAERLKGTMFLNLKPGVAGK